MLGVIRLSFFSINVLMFIFNIKIKKKIIFQTFSFALFTYGTLGHSPFMFSPHLSVNYQQLNYTNISFRLLFSFEKYKIICVVVELYSAAATSHWHLVVYLSNNESSHISFVRMGSSGLLMSGLNYCVEPSGAALIFSDVCITFLCCSKHIPLLKGINCPGRCWHLTFK